MAMLAERKTKRKWCLNPNGKDWSSDNNKFGQKMLEKMGWKKGCGLGINLQGQKEHVKVSVKNNSKGLGCDANHDLEWLNHQENYNTLLSELSSSIGDGILTDLESSSGKSLEDKSKTSRARVHYKKFVRGKDVSRYSGTDLMCILGKTEAVAQKRPIDDVENEVPETNPKINVKKKKKDKSDNRIDEEIVGEYSDDGKCSNEVICYSDTDSTYVVGKTESVIDETRPFDGVENEVSETNDQTSMKMKKKKNSSEESEDGRDEEFVTGNDVGRYSGTDLVCIVGKTEVVTQEKRPIDDVENEVPETNSKFSLKKRKKDKSDDRCVKEIVQEYSDDRNSRNEVIGNSDTDQKCVVGKKESVTEVTRPVDGVETGVLETNGQASMKKKKKKVVSLEESDDGRDEVFVEESPENRKSKRRKSVESVEVSSRNTAVWKEELQRKSQGDEISTPSSFTGSNLHVVKGYKYNRR